jgi:hypothetical protein
VTVVVWRLLLAAGLALAACSTGDDDSQDSGKPYLFYLHGQIIEDQGPEGVSPVHGPYDYHGIIEAFRERGFEVHSEVRPHGTDPSAYADKVVGQVRELLVQGVDPSRISVVGASKGAVIAMLVSSRLGEGKVRYVLLANCNDWVIRTFDPHLTGHVLSIYEASDDTGGSCGPLAARSPRLEAYKELRVDTGLGHGLVYRPLDLWVDPATRWSSSARVLG